MKFKIFSIFAGIGQAMAMFVCLYAVMFVLKTLVPASWLAEEVLAIGGLVALVMCIIVGLAYPVYLFRKKKHADAIAVIVSTIISVGIFLWLLSIAVEQMFRNID